MTADVDLDTLTRLAQAATPGPWDHEHDDYGDEWWFGGNSGGGQEVIRSGNYSWMVTDPSHAADATYIAAVSPNVVLALVERVRAAETAIERVRAAVGVVERARTRFDDPHIFGWLDAIARDFSDALDGPGTPATIKVDPESTDDPNGPQNAANEGDA